MGVKCYLECGCALAHVHMHMHMLSAKCTSTSKSTSTWHRYAHAHGHVHAHAHVTHAHACIYPKLATTLTVTTHIDNYQHKRRRRAVTSACSPFPPPLVGRRVWPGRWRARQQLDIGVEGCGVERLWSGEGCGVGRGVEWRGCGVERLWGGVWSGEVVGTTADPLLAWLHRGS